MAVVYLVAFASLAVQIEGLYGSRGILPVADHLEALGTRLGEGAWHRVPTLFWWRADDLALVAACWAGVACAAALLVGVVPTIAAALCWILYLSLFQVGRVFLGFQWDILLLEAGFLAIFVAPLRWRAGGAHCPQPPAAVVWLLRFLLFRLMFASGAVKLLSDDPVWWNLTALEYHYWTQPLPTWTAWMAHQLPAWSHQACVGAMFVIELAVPFLIFGPRRARIVAFVLLVLLQVLIAATGNYTYFNLLTVVLCIPLLDDGVLDACRGRLGLGARPPAVSARRWPPGVVIARRTIAVALAIPLATAGAAQMLARFHGFEVLPAPVVSLVRTIEPWRLTSSYGLFASMTTRRPEIVLEGSLDGHTWREYEFRWKPGNVQRRPAFVAPHQPRLDWQMWFAALGDWPRNGWLVALQDRLLEGSPPVLDLLAGDPFEGERPRYIRAVLYDYRFADAETRSETGDWWVRRPLRLYSPVRSSGR